MQELLFARSEYSIMQAVSSVEEIAKKAANAGYNHVILANTDCIADIPKFLHQSSIHPIPGVTISSDFNFTLIAKEESSLPKITKYLLSDHTFEGLSSIIGSSKDTICLVHISDFLKTDCDLPKEAFSQREYDKLLKKREEAKESLCDLEKERERTKSIASRVFFKKEEAVHDKEEARKLEDEKMESEQAKKELPKIDGKIRRRKVKIEELNGKIKEMEEAKERLEKDKDGVTDGQIKKMLDPYIKLFQDNFYNVVFTKDDNIARILRLTKKYGIKNVLAKFADMADDSTENKEKADYINSVSGKYIISKEDYIYPFNYHEFLDKHKRIKDISFENDSFVNEIKDKFSFKREDRNLRDIISEKCSQEYCGKVFGERLEEELKEAEKCKARFLFYLDVKDNALGGRRISCNKAGSILLYILGLSSVDPTLYDIPFDGFDNIRFFIDEKQLGSCGRGLKECRNSLPGTSFDILTGLEKERYGVIKEDLPVITKDIEKYGVPVLWTEHNVFVSAVERSLESIYLGYGKKLSEIPFNAQLINKSLEKKDFFLMPFGESLEKDSFGKILSLEDLGKIFGGEYWKAVLFFRCVWLKANYPQEYFTACLNAMNQEEARGALKNCKKYGLKLECPDINRSAADYIVKPGVLLYGLSAIKDVGSQAEVIVNSRGSGYTSFADFLIKARITKQAVKSLIMSGAFSQLHPSRSGLLLVYEQMYKRVQRRNTLEDRILEKDKKLLLCKTKKEEEQLRKTLQREMEEKEIIEKNLLQIHIPTEKTESIQEKAMMESAVLPFNANRNVLDLYGDDLPFTTAITNIKENENVKLFGYISHVRFFKTKKNNKEMASFILEDKTGKMAVTCWPKTLDQYGKYLKENEAVLVYGKVEKDPVTNGCQVFSSFIGLPESFLPQTVIHEDTFASFDEKEYGNDIEKNGSRVLVYCRDTGRIEVTDLCLTENIECDGKKIGKVKKYLEKIGKTR